MGGLVATMFLRLYPKMVVGIIYLDSFWLMPETYLTSEQRAQLAKDRTDDIKFRAMAESLVNSPATSVETKQAVLQAMMATPVHVRISATSTGSLPQVLPRETTFSLPALHLAVQGGYRDADWKHHLPNLEVREFPKVCHFLHMDDSQTINTAIEEFIERSKLFHDVPRA
jgi:pimeloyl-ACP methyl ester carboxylesterase